MPERAWSHTVPVHLAAPATELEGAQADRKLKGRQPPRLQVVSPESSEGKPKKVRGMDHVCGSARGGLEVAVGDRPASAQVSGVERVLGRVRDPVLEPLQRPRLLILICDRATLGRRCDRGD